MNDYMKSENEKFFNQIIHTINENGAYVWKDELEVFRIKEGCMVGTESAVEKVKAITPESFWNKLIVE